MLAAQERQPVEKEPQEAEHDDDQEAQEVRADIAAGEAVHALQHAAARRKGAENHQEVGQPDQDDIPDLEDATLFLDDDAVQEGSAREPGQEAGVLHRIPCPVAAPAQFHVRPLAAHDDAQRQEDPGDERPATHGAHPLVAESLAEQRTYGKCKGDGHADIAQVEHDGMDDHPVVLQQRIEPLTVGRHKTDALEGVGGKDQQRQEEKRGRQQYGVDVGHQRPGAGGDWRTQRWRCSQTGASTRRAGCPPGRPTAPKTCKTSAAPARSGSTHSSIERRR